MPTGPKTAPKLTGEDRRPGDRPEEHAQIDKQRSRRRPNIGTGTAPKMRTAPQSIAKPGRFRFLPGLLCIGVVLLDWYLREWANRCYAIRGKPRLHTI